MGEKILSVQESIDEERGLVELSRTTDTYTTKLYKILSWKDDPNIHLINYVSTNNKDKRRQMTLTSIRNLVSHIATVSYSNFMHVVYTWK